MTHFAHRAAKGNKLSRYFSNPDIRALNRMSLSILDDSLQYGTRGRCTCDKKHDPNKTNPNRFDKHNKKEGGNLTCYGIGGGPPRNARNSGPPLP